MTEFWQTVIGILGSVGVGGAIVAALSSWLGKVWAERLMAKESAKYREELERLSKQLEHKNYVSKVRFDAEFAIYRDLSAAFLEVVQAQNVLFPNSLVDRVPKDKQEQKAFYMKRANKCGEAYNNAVKQLYCSAPFIDEHIFEQFDKIRNGVWEQLSKYPIFFTSDDASQNRKDFNDEFKECYQRTQDINGDMDKLISDLRAYLKKLDVA